MLFFILYIRPREWIVKNIQIHLMLFFISGWYGSGRGRQDSNTSHVILYHRLDRHPVSEDTFKYISCYSLSCCSRFLYSCLRHSNTSHVILYRYILPCSTVVLQFKYISCYSLSQKGPYIHHSLQAFKYISCYSLSVIESQTCDTKLHSNTSHVILYPSRGWHTAISSRDSNTSHVILYRLLSPLPHR